MIRIFIPQFICFIEEFDLNFIYDTFVTTSNLSNNVSFANEIYLIHKMPPLRFPYLDLYNLHPIFEDNNYLFAIYPWQNFIFRFFYSFVYMSPYLGRFWIYYSEFHYFSLFLSMYSEYIYVGKYSMLNPEHIYLWYNVDVRKTDLCLYHDIVTNIWSPLEVNYMEYYTRPYNIVFYKFRSFRYEWLWLMFEIYFWPSFYLYLLDPHSVWFDINSRFDFIYARQWVIMAYMTFDKYAYFPSDSLWISNYFTNFFYFYRITTTYKYNWLFFFDSNAIYFLEFYFSSYIIYLFLLFMVFISNKKIIINYFFLLEPYLFLKYLNYKTYNILIFFRRAIRLRRLKYMKKIGKKISRKSHVENYYFNLLIKYFFKRIISLNYNYIYNYKNFYSFLQKNFLSDPKNFSIIYFNFFIFLFFFSLIFWFFYMIKNILYYIYIFYYIKIRKYVFFFNYIPYKYSFRFYNYIISNIVYERDVYKVDAYDTYKRLINYINVHRKSYYKKKVKESVIQIYDATMWTGLPDWDEKRDEYINYFYSKVFVNYYPSEEIKDVFYPRIVSKYYLNKDFSYHKINIYNLNIFLTFIWTKFIYFNVRKIIKLTFLRYFIYYRFWKIYFYYYFTMYNNALNKFNNIFKLYVLYIYTMYIYIYLYLSNICYFIFSEKRILIKYYYKYYFNFLFDYFIKVNFFKYTILFFSTIYFHIYILFNYIYDIIYLCLNLLYIRIWNFYYYIFKSERGYDYNFWYTYYMFKFYLIEYNIFLNIFVFFRNLFFNFILFLMVFYIISTIPIFYDFSTKYIIVFVKDFINLLYVYLNNDVSYYTIPSNDIGIFNANYKQIFDHYVNFYHNNFALYLHKIHEYIIVNIQSREHKYTRLNYEVVKQLFEWIYNNAIMIGNFNIPLAFDILFPNAGLGAWPALFYMHFYLFIKKMPERVMMIDMYWNFLPIWFLFFWKLKKFFFYYYILIPLYWLWQYSFSFIVYYCLWLSSFFFPINYIIYYFFQIMYYIYVYVYMFFFNFYYYYIYYFWIVLHNFLKPYFIFYNFHELLKYDSIKFFIGIDIINFLKFIFYSFILILQSLFNGLFLFFYKISVYISTFLGLNSLFNIDFFSIEISSKFRSFIRDFYNCILITDYYDMDDFNSLFYEYAQKKAGKKRKGGIFMKSHRIKKSFMIIKFRMIPFEYKVRGFLFSSSELLTHMIYYKDFFDFRAFYLYCFMLFSIYFNFFLILFVSGILFLKFRNLFKDRSHLYNSATYEWKTFVRKNRIKLGFDDFYWLYNLRWLKGFEFYLDKYFKDDLYIHIFKSDNYIFGIYLYETLNELFFFTNPTASELVDHNRYLKFRRYYFGRYTKFIKDIDYLFHIFSISSKKLKKKGKFFSIYNFFIPFFRKKNFKKYNSLYETQMLLNLNKLDSMWLFFVTPYLLYDRDWYDMKVFSQSLVSKQLYADLKKSLFKAYGVFEMNQKDIKLDLFEFQFFDKDFYNNLNEHWGNVDKSVIGWDNPVLRRIIYSRVNTILLYTSYDKDTPLVSELYNTLDYENFLFKLEEYLIYLKNLNNTYFSGLIEFSLFSFIDSISYTLTHLTPDIAKTAVDIEQGKLIGVSYKKSMLLDEFTSTEITESVFDSVDNFLVKENHNNMEMHRVLLREDPYNNVRPISSWWVIFIIIPFFFLYFELDIWFKYGRFILPHFAIIEWMDYVFKQFFSIYFIEPYLWNKIWWHDHIDWSRRLRYQFKRGHLRTMIWDTRWLELQSFWYGEFAHLVQIKLDYAWFYVYKINERYYRSFKFDFFWDFYLNSLISNTKSYLFFLLLDFISYLFYLFIIIFILNFIFYVKYLKAIFGKIKISNMQTFLDIFKTSDFEKILESQYKIENELKNFKYRNRFADFEDRVKKHKRLSLFIYNYKKAEKEKEEKKNNNK